jgi:hypothetical protein
MKACPQLIILARYPWHTLTHHQVTPRLGGGTDTMEEQGLLTATPTQGWNRQPVRHRADAVGDMQYPQGGGVIIHIP